MYASLNHEKEMPAFLRFPPAKSYTRYQHLWEDFPERASLIALRRFGLRYIIIESHYYDGQAHPSIQTIESALAEVPRLKKVAVIDEFIIYEFER